MFIYFIIYIFYIIFICISIFSISFSIYFTISIIFITHYQVQPISFQLQNNTHRHKQFHTFFHFISIYFHVISFNLIYCMLISISHYILSHHLIPVHSYLSFPNKFHTIYITSFYSIHSMLQAVILFYLCHVTSNRHVIFPNWTSGWQSASLYIDIHIPSHL